MPSACQPSKKVGSSCTHRWYFSTALFKSPTATSPLASSKISSGVCIYSRNGHKGHNEREREAPNRNFRRALCELGCESLSFLKFQPCSLLPVAQPFDENDSL